MKKKRKKQHQRAKSASAIIESLASSLAARYLHQAKVCPPKVWLIEFPALGGVNQARKAAFDRLVARRAIALVEARGYRPKVILAEEEA